MARGETGHPTSPHKLGDAELNTIGYVVSRYSSITGKDLEHPTRSEDPWREANADRQPGTDVPIDPDSIARYFEVDHADGSINSPAIREWLRRTASRSQVRPDGSDDTEKLRAKLREIEARIAQRA